MSDITLKELAGGPAELISPSSPLVLFELGHGFQDPVFAIYPEGDANVSQSGPVALVVTGFIYPEGDKNTAQSGPITLVMAGFILPPGSPSTVASGEPFLAGATSLPVDPTISNVTPAGSNIGAQTKWSARLSLSPANGVISRILINVEYPAGASEEAFVDGAFTPDYNGQSTIVESSPGVFDITMIRNGGWPSSPRMRVHANTNRGGMTQ